MRRGAVSRRRHRGVFGDSITHGGRINGTRFVKGHDSNYAPVRDLDIADYLKFGEVNTIALGHEWDVGQKKSVAQGHSV